MPDKEVTETQQALARHSKQVQWTHLAVICLVPRCVNDLRRQVSGRAHPGVWRRLQVLMLQSRNRKKQTGQAALAENHSFVPRSMQQGSSITLEQAKDVV